MGESAAETVREIEQTRHKIEVEIEELERRLPPARSVRKAAAIAAGGGAGGTLFWFAMRRRRRSRRRGGDETVAARDGGGWMLSLAVAGGAAVALHAAELKALREIRDALEARGETVTDR